MGSRGTENPTQDIQMTSAQKSGREEAGSNLLEYWTDNPGPGAYDVASGFGAMPTMPTARHGGSFSFTGRDKVPACLRSPPTVGPAHYDPPKSAGSACGRRTPCWVFPARRCESQNSREFATPGPGEYEAKFVTQGPEISMGQRWGVCLHPSQRPGHMPVRGARKLKVHPRLS